MATTTVEVLVTPAAPGVGAGDPADPYRYGWRYVRRKQANGRIDYEQVPLTQEDVLHPEVGDQVTHSDAHGRRCVYLFDVLRDQLVHDPTAVVLHDVLVAWDVPDLRPHGPDIAVILGVRERKNWSTFDVADEKVRPALIIEVVSPETARLDRQVKKKQYASVRVPLYVVVDTVMRRRQPVLRLEGYRLTRDGYQPLGPDERGRLWLEPARVWLGVEANEIVCYDEAGQPLGDYQALAAANRALATTLSDETQARAAAEQQAEAERQARIEAERQVEEERQARIEAERRVEEERQARADAERQTEAERQARAAAEARLRELEAELRRLRHEPREDQRRE